MLTEFARDHVFTIAWFGLMAVVWFGWAQEDPPSRWRAPLGVGSVVGMLIAGLFGFGVFTRWSTGTAMEGKYAWFGVLVGAELLLAAVGCLLLARRGHGRWMAWWVAFVVALHFLPLVVILDDPSLALLGILQAAGLLFLIRRLRESERPTSRLVGPWMGLTLLAFAAVSAVMFLVSTGSSW